MSGGYLLHLLWLSFLGPYLELQGLDPPPGDRDGNSRSWKGALLPLSQQRPPGTFFQPAVFEALCLDSHCWRTERKEQSWEKKRLEIVTSSVDTGVKKVPMLREFQGAGTSFHDSLSPRGCL